MNKRLAPIQSVPNRSTTTAPTAAAAAIALFFKSQADVYKRQAPTENPKS